MEAGRVSLSSEISTVYIPSIQLCDDGVCLRRVCIVGTHTPSIQVLSLESEDCFRVLNNVTFDTEVSSSLRELKIPNSLTLFDEDKRQYLLAGLRDGHLYAYQWQWIIGRPGPIISAPESRKLGVSPVLLITDMYQTFNRILTLSDTTWLITSVKGHLNQVSLSSSKALHAAPFSNPNSYISYMLLQDSTLKYVHYNLNDTVDIVSVPIPDIPRRVLFDSMSQKLLVGSWKKSGSDVLSDVKILDEDTGTPRPGISLHKNERLTVLAKWVVEHASRPGRRYICIGTANYRKTSSDEPRGRVLVYSFKKQPGNGEIPGLLQLKILSELVLPQNVQCVTAFMQRYLLVGAGNKVYRLKIEPKDRTYVFCYDTWIQY